jgi:hypothetical protein
MPGRGREWRLVAIFFFGLRSSCPRTRGSLRSTCRVVDQAGHCGGALGGRSLHRAKLAVGVCNLWQEKLTRTGDESALGQKREPM